MSKKNNCTTKTILRMAMLLMTAVLLLSFLTACGGLSGTYCSDGIGTLEFKSDNKVIYTEVDHGLSDVMSYEGTYQIDGDTIVFDFGTDDVVLQGENTFKQGNGWIEIDGFSFEKNTDDEQPQYIRF